MTDIEEAISFIKSTEKHLRSIGESWFADYLDDAIDLLKEQEAKKVNISQAHCGMKYGLCPTCGKQIDTLVNPNYCGCCGQAVKWE